MLVAADAAAQLVQVGQAVAVGLVDEDRVGIGNVEAAFDDRRRQQQVELVRRRSRPSPLPARPRASGRGRCAMRASGTICRSRLATISMSLHAVVDEVDLPAAVQFAQDRVADQLVVPARRPCVSTARRSSGGVSRFEMSRTPTSDMCSVRGIGVAESASAHRPSCRSAFSRSFTSTPNRCSSSMMTSPRLWNSTSFDASRCVPMTMSTLPAFSPSTISRSSSGVQKRLSLAMSNGKLGHPLAEAVEVLLGEDRRRHEHGHLVAVVDRLERGPHGDFGLAEADVAAEQPVHRPRPLHVGLDRVDRGELVGRFVIGKRRVELALPVAVGRERDARPRARASPAARAFRRPDRRRPLRPPPSA